jgi:hypothetical protein
MKNARGYTRIIGVILCGLSCLLAGCEGAVGGAGGGSSGGGYSVTLNLGEIMTAAGALSASRAVNPADYYYEIQMDGPGGARITKNVPVGTTVVTVEVGIGQWDIRVNAYRSSTGTLEYQGTASLDVGPGKANRATVKMNPYGGTPHRLSISSFTGGSIRASPAAGTVISGTLVTLTASSDTGWYLFNLTVNSDSGGLSVPVSGTGNTRTFTMPAGDVTVSAEFIEGTSAGIEAVIRAAGVGAAIALPGGVYTMTSAITVDKDVTITTGAGETVILERDAAFNAEFFEVSSMTSLGVKLTLSTTGGGTLTLDGMNVNSSSSSLVEVYSGELEINDGVILRNNYAGSGGAVGVQGMFTMNGGTITNNTDRSGGGGVNVSAGRFTMSGGTIEGNRSGIPGSSISGGGGGVNVSAAGMFTMSGGTIRNNVAYVDGSPSYGWGGGGVNVSAGMFTMSGGTIEGNHTDRDGGGVYVVTGGNFDLITPSGTGSITGNSAALNGPQVFVDTGGGIFNVNGSPGSTY